MFNKKNHSCSYNIVCLERECSRVTCLCQIENYHKNHNTIQKSEFTQKLQQYLQNYPNINEYLQNLKQLIDQLNSIINLISANLGTERYKYTQNNNEIKQIFDSLHQNSQIKLQQNVCQQLIQNILLEQSLQENIEIFMKKNINWFNQNYDSEKQMEQEYTIKGEWSNQQRFEQENNQNQITHFECSGYQNKPSNQENKPKKQKVCVESKQIVKKLPNLQIKNTDIRQQFSTKFCTYPILEILQIQSTTDRVLVLNNNNQLILYDYSTNFIVKEFPNIEVQTMRVNYGFLVIQDLDFNFIIYNIQQKFRQEAKIFCYTSQYQILQDQQLIYTEKDKFLIQKNWKDQSKSFSLYESKQEINFFLVYQKYYRIVLIENYKTIMVMQLQKSSTEYSDKKYEQHYDKNILDLKYQTQEELIIVYSDGFIIFNVEKLTIKASISIGQFSFIQPIINTEQIFILFSDQHDCSKSIFELRNLHQMEIICQFHNQGPQAITMNDKQNTIIVGDDLGWITTYKLQKK